jgi:hypothetical protein
MAARSEQISSLSERIKALFRVTANTDFAEAEGRAALDVGNHEEFKGLVDQMLGLDREGVSLASLADYATASTFSLLSSNIDRLSVSVREVTSLFPSTTLANLRYLISAGIRRNALENGEIVTKAAMQGLRTQFHGGSDRAVPSGVHKGTGTVLSAFTWFVCDFLPACGARDPIGVHRARRKTSTPNPACAACAFGEPEVLRLFADRGVDLRCTDGPLSEAPAVMAYVAGNADCFKICLEAGLKSSDRFPKEYPSEEEEDGRHRPVLFFFLLKYFDSGPPGKQSEEPSAALAVH